jgi:hypothetical protein
MLVLLVTFALAFAIILTWPIRFAIKLIKVGNPYKSAILFERSPGDHEHRAILADHRCADHCLGGYGG